MDRHDRKHSHHHDKKPYSRDSRDSRDSGNRSKDYDRDQRSDKKYDKSKDRDYGKDKNKEYGKQFKKEEEEKPVENKEQPNLALSGNLAKDTNLFNGIVIKYNEPSEARKPKRRWRLYVFKGEEELPFYQIHRQSAYLFGRERKCADIPVDHPSCSKQHAVFQFRSVTHTKDDGKATRIIKPYVIDLGSTNGTYINNERVEPQRYYELKEKDVLKFGFSSREYVLLHEESKDDENEDDNDSSSSEDDEPVEVGTKKVEKKQEENNSEDDDDD